MDHNSHIQESVKMDSVSAAKLLIFEIGKLTLALPVEQVQRVTRYDEVYGSGLSHVNLIHWQDSEITVIDLHRKLFKVSEPASENSKKYIIISRNITGEPLGILVSQTPTLIDVPLSQIRIVPNSYRYADTLEIASHVAIVPQTERKPLTIFILDLQRAI